MKEGSWSVRLMAAMRFPAYRNYVLAVMTAVYTLNLTDRILIMLLLQPIKVELQLSDTQLGFVTGIAFGLFYAVLGLPIARLADRGNRVTIASVSIGLWGLTMMGGLFVTNYIQLVFARIAAAVGEVGCKPPTYSLTGDYFPQPEERTRAMAVYWLGSPLSSLLAFIVGGWLSDQYGWRATFALMGVPGLILAVLVKSTLAEPRERFIGVQSRQPLPPVRSVLQLLWRRRACRHLGMSLILLYGLGYGLSPWYAAFLMRSHGMGTAEVGVWLGLVFGVGGIAGLLLGGTLAARYFARNVAGQMHLSAITVGSLLPFYVAFLLLTQKYQALGVLIPLTVVFNIFMAPTYALMQRLVSDDMRATTLAILMLLAHLIGMGLAPQAVGMMSDLFAPSLGTDSLRYAMLIMSTVTVWAAWHFWAAARTVRQDLASAGQDVTPSREEEVEQSPVSRGTV